MNKLKHWSKFVAGGNSSNSPSLHAAHPKAGLLELPLEIRQQIYSYAIGNIPDGFIPPYVPHGPYGYKQTFGCNEVCNSHAYCLFSHSTGSLLNVNRQLMSEVANLIASEYQSVWLSFRAPSQCIRFLNAIPHYLPELEYLKVDVPISEAHLMRPCLECAMSSYETRVKSLSLLFQPCDADFKKSRPLFEGAISKVLNRVKRMPAEMGRDIWFSAGGGWGFSKWYHRDQDTPRRQYHFYFYPVVTNPRSAYKLKTWNVGYDGMEWGPRTLPRYFQDLELYFQDPEPHWLQRFVDHLEYLRRRWKIMLRFWWI